MSDKIVTFRDVTRPEKQWVAHFESYDGAPDAPNRAEYGTGDTKSEAIAALLNVDDRSLCLACDASGYVYPHTGLLSTKPERCDDCGGNGWLYYFDGKPCSHGHNSTTCDACERDRYADRMAPSDR